IAGGSAPGRGGSARGLREGGRRAEAYRRLHRLARAGRAFRCAWRGRARPGRAGLTTVAGASGERYLRWPLDKAATRPRPTYMLPDTHRSLATKRGLPRSQSAAVPEDTA